MTERRRVLIVDDEPLARAGVRRLLAKRTDVEICGECKNGREAIEMLLGDPPDLVLLDVEMPEITGLDVLEAVGPEDMPPVVFVTAHDRYAVEAFEAHAVDYVLKPVDPSRFDVALERALQAIANRNEKERREQLEQLLMRYTDREKYPARLILKANGRVNFVPVEEVEWVEAADNYLRVHVGDRYFLQRETMTHLESRLNPGEFVRIHRSTIVRFDCIRRIMPLGRGDSCVLLNSGQELSVSRRFRSRLDAML